jgi:glycosyltransferase involved in cell wall biosynthesis
MVSQMKTVSEKRPYVSLILCIKNGMPYVKEAIQSVQALTYPYYELIVQDGVSTDGTLEYLETVSTQFDFKYSIHSEQDSGIGQGYNKALKRCQGDIIGSIDADNIIHANALETVIDNFRKNPNAAVIYGACDMIDAQGKFIHHWTPSNFNLLRLIDGDLVPPFATSFFQKKVCGEYLFFDDFFPTVVDFDLWLRLSHLPIVRIFDTLASIRVGKMSSTYNVDYYDKFCYFKIKALERFFDQDYRENQILDEILERAKSGIYLWAVDSIGVIQANQSQENQVQINKYFSHFLGNQGIESLRFSERFFNIIRRTNPKVESSHSLLFLGYAQEYLMKGEYEKALLCTQIISSSLPENEAVSLNELIEQIRDGMSKVPSVEKIQEEISKLQEEIGKRDQIIEQSYKVIKGAIFQKIPALLKLYQLINATQKN